MMKRLLLTGVACWWSLMALGQEEACLVTTPPAIDAQANDWTTEWKEDDSHIFKYNICTDENTLYVRVKVSDPMTQRKMAMFGFTLWLDPKGKKKQKLGLRFPTGYEAKERMEALKSQGEFNREETAPQREERQKQVKKDLITDIEVLELLGLADKPLTSTRSGITTGLKVAIAMDEQGDYVYEASIPFKSYRLSKAQIPVLGVGFATGKFEPPKDKTNNNSGGGMPGGGFGGSGYGGGYGGGYGAMGGGQRMRQGGGGYSSSPVLTPTRTWTSIKLN